MKHVVLPFLLFITAAAVAQKNIQLTKGAVIHESVNIQKEIYKILSDTGFSTPLLVIEGNFITVDFNDAVLQGGNDPTKPNEFTGLAVLIKKGSSYITLKNANIHGYKIAIMAEDVFNLTIENCNLSYNYRQQLHSNWEREDISDWMSYHHNEHDEWMRYGAGIYLKDCNRAVIKANTIINGQCGLMMMRCNDANIFDNNFSFNSGLGIGMYRSSNNHIYHNRLDFNARGFSFGKYYRGQDSAGILVFEQCNNNVFAYNSVTHGGDGFFLWAGQYTMDTGEGGCNDNLLYGNDFSYAPTNGVELTFSRNSIEKNIIRECDHGVWGGYSFSTLIYNNSFANNRIAIAIEHGQKNQVFANRFKNDKTAIKLWSRTSQPAGWGYAQKRDTRSVDYHIIANDYRNNEIVYDILGTDSIKFAGNTKANYNAIYKFGERSSNIDTSDENAVIDVTSTRNKKIDALKVSAMPPTIFPQGKNQMRITEWGPYNFEYPILWLDSLDKNGIYHFEILGKPGTWKLIASKGFSVVEQSRYSFPSTLLARADLSAMNRSIELNYLGEAFADMFGQAYAANKPYTFQYKEFDAQAKWTINFYKWDSTNNPVNNFEPFSRALTHPFYTTTANKIDYTWWGAIGKDLPVDSFATIATTTIDLPEADYEIGITADDLAKLFIDNKPVIDAWDPHYVDLDENTHHSIVLHLSGGHDFKIVHADISGLATLMFYIKPR